ncbi:Coenzyme Q-binding protein COQ10 [Diplonema papillatum]|nr:Coenzyme Q-binding protein COQ10 [Diplonema papillatum]|eukprot:gene6339-9713_t
MAYRRTLPHRAFMDMFQSSVRPRVFHKKKIVPHTCEEVFRVVSDVAKYKEYLPYVKDSVVTKRLDKNSFEARLTIGFSMGLEEQYTSRVKAVEALSVTSEALDSSYFSTLTSDWEFRPIDSASCSVAFTLTYAAKNPVVRLTIDSAIADLADKQIRALQQRCDHLYLPRAKATLGSGEKPEAKLPVGAPDGAGEKSERRDPRSDLTALFVAARALAHLEGLPDNDLDQVYAESKRKFESRDSAAAA